MKLIIIALIILTGFFTACKKEVVTGESEGFVKSLECEIDVAVVGNVMLSDNSIIIVCRAQEEKVPGYIYKIDDKGNLLWKKRLASNNNGVWQVYDFLGNGFTLLGYDKVEDAFFEVSHYDDDGNFISSKKISFRNPANQVGYFGPFQMIRLSNGNFVFTGNYQCDIVMYFTNNSYDTLGRTLISRPWGSGNRGVYQNSDSTIAVASAYAVTDAQTGYYQFDTYINLTDLNGNLISETALSDSLYNEAPSVLLPLGNNLLMITARLGSFSDGSGTVVSYLNSPYGRLCSGEINLVHLTADGQFISRQGIRDYPENGLIMNAQPTSDGGYILCGTVNQPDNTGIVAPTRIYIMKVDASGIFEWSETINTIYPSYGVDAVQTKDGGYFISGYEKAFDKKYKAIVIKTDAKGNIY